MSNFGKLVSEMGYEIDKLVRQISAERSYVEDLEKKIENMDNDFESTQTALQEKEAERAHLEECLKRELELCETAKATAYTLERREHSLNEALQQLESSHSKIRERRDVTLKKYEEEFHQFQDYAHQHRLLLDFLNFVRKTQNDGSGIVGGLPERLQKFFAEFPTEYAPDTLKALFQELCEPLPFDTPASGQGQDSTAASLSVTGDLDESGEKENKPNWLKRPRMDVGNEYETYIDDATDKVKAMGETLEEHSMLASTVDGTPIGSSHVDFVMTGKSPLAELSQHDASTNETPVHPEGDISF